MVTSNAEDPFGAARWSRCEFGLVRVGVGKIHALYSMVEGMLGWA